MVYRDREYRPCYTEEEEAIFREAAENGWSWEELHEALPHRPLSALPFKMRRMGLVRRVPTPQPDYEALQRIRELRKG